MPLSNRVTPLGAVIATPQRGLVFGNRGCLHDVQRQHPAPFAGRRWIACRLEFRGWRRTPLMMPGRYTELFFLDEATAFAAGHRPCALCRYADYRRFGDFWTERHPGQRGADAIDAQLHAERLDGDGAAPSPRALDAAARRRLRAGGGRALARARRRAAGVDAGGYAAGAPGPVAVGPRSSRHLHWWPCSPPAGVRSCPSCTRRRLQA